MNQLLYYSRAILFFSVTFSLAMSIVFIQLPLLLIYFPYLILFYLRWDSMAIKVHRLYRGINRIAESFFGSLLVFIIWFFIPTRFILTGDHEQMRRDSKLIVMSNHQIYPDWLYLWALAHHQGRHGDIKILLMSILKYIPILGIGMFFYEFIFLDRKWSKDQATLSFYLKRSLQDQTPLWLLIFPEGTLNTPNNRETSEKYALKMGLSEKPEFVILPKSTGLFHCTKVLYPSVNTLYDVTVGYSGIKSTDIPYEEYLVENCFFAGKYPKAVHMHIKAFPIHKIPGCNVVEENEKTTNDFNKWVRKRFMEKDHLLKEFYDLHKFEESGVESCTRIISIKPKILDILAILILGTSLVWTVPFYFNLILSFFKLFYSF